MKVETLQRLINIINRGLFFDQPVIGTELTLSRMDSVEYWKEDSSFLTNQPDCFRIGSYQ